MALHRRCALHRGARLRNDGGSLRWLLTCLEQALDIRGCAADDDGDLLDRLDLVHLVGPENLTPKLKGATRRIGIAVFEQSGSQERD